MISVAILEMILVAQLTVSIIIYLDLAVYYLNYPMHTE